MLETNKKIVEHGVPFWAMCIREYWCWNDVDGRYYMYSTDGVGVYHLFAYEGWNDDAPNPPLPPNTRITKTFNMTNQFKKGTNGE